MISTASTGKVRTAFVRGGFVAGFALLAVLAIHIGVQYSRAPETQPEFGVTESLRQLWQDWTAFEGFRTHTINTVVGGGSTVALTPVVFVTLWIGVSVLLWYALTWWQRQRPGPLPVVLFLLLGWLVLDARWLWDLQRQLQLSHDLFAGKTDAEKRRSEPGLAGASYRFAETLLDNLEPDRPARVFVLSPQRYWRYRVNYFLLPYNSVAEGVDPTALRSGDILVLFDEPSIIGRPLAPSTHADATAGRIMLMTRDGRPLGVAHMLVRHAGGYALRME